MKVILSEQHLAELNALLFELPHKYAVPLINFFNRRVAEQQKKKAAPQKEAR